MTQQRVAVFGGRGFVGDAVTEAIRDAGYTAVTMDPNDGGKDHETVSILAEDLSSILADYDVVVNLVGLSPFMRPRDNGYQRLHVDAVEHLLSACEDAGVERIVHMSALGAGPDAPTAFLRTKGRGQRLVEDSDIPHTVFRPSVIFDYGNELIEQAEMLASLRVFPHISTKIQPIYRHDVATLFATAVDGKIEEDVLDIAGVDVMTVFSFVEAIYEANGHKCLPLPVEDLIKLTLPFAELIPFSPVGSDQARSLDIDNTTDHNDAPAYIDELVRYGDWIADTYRPD